MVTNRCTVVVHFATAAAVDRFVKMRFADVLPVPRNILDNVARNQAVDARMVSSASVDRFVIWGFVDVRMVTVSVRSLKFAYRW